MSEIKAGDLRIGNILLFGKKTNLIVYEIRFDRKEKWLINGIPLSLIDPVVLNSEILSSIGFISDTQKMGGYTYWYYGESLWAIRDKNDNAYQFAIIVRPDEIWKFDAEIKYLHQLMNLFYALTSTELEIKL